MIVKNPKIADEMMPTRKKLKSDEEILLLDASKNFLSPAPAITGPDRRNANLADSSRVKPRNKPPEIVEPLLETPGIKAIDWNKPIIIALNIVRSFLFLIFLPKYSDDKITTLNKMSAKATRVVLLNTVDICRSKTRPKKTAGNVPTNKSDKSLFLKLNIVK